MSRRGRLQSLRARAVLLLLAFAATCDFLNDTEFECEQAVAHLAQCCPGFATDEVHCRAAGCNNDLDLHDDASRCIESMTCAQIAAHSFCDVRNVIGYGSVCP